MATTSSPTLMSARAARSAAAGNTAAVECDEGDVVGGVAPITGRQRLPLELVETVTVGGAVHHVGVGEE